MFTPIENLTIPVLDEFNKNEINIDGIRLIAYHDGRQEELQEVLDYLNQLPKPTKQVQELIGKLQERQHAYKREAPL